MDEQSENDFHRCGSSIDAYVLYCLMDGEIHTMQEIADKYEVSKMTIRRAVERLGIKFIIHSFSSGIGDKRGGGGIYLDEQHLYFGLTKDGITQKRKAKLKRYKVKP